MEQQAFGASPVLSTSLHTNEVDEAREALGALYEPIEISSIGRGPLDLEVNSVQLALVTAGFIRFGGEANLRATDVRSYHINIPLEGHAINSWADGQQQIAEASVSAVLFMPGMPADVEWSAGCAQIALMIPAHEVRLQLETMLDRSIRAPVEFEHRLDLRPKSAISWLGLVAIILREASRRDGLLSHQLAAGNLQQLLIEGLLLTQPHNYTDALVGGVCAASPAVVTHAIDLMRTHPEAPWTAGKLAQHTGIGARALTKAFARSGEQPPMTYLRELRLQRVRGTLLDADPRSVTVTAVAGRWGFVHLGRFAKQYHQVFGEHPSTTLGSDRFASPTAERGHPAEVA